MIPGRRRHRRYVPPRPQLELSPDAREVFQFTMANLQLALRNHRPEAVVQLPPREIDPALNTILVTEPRPERRVSAGTRAAREHYDAWYTKNRKLLWTMARDHSHGDVDLTKEIASQAGLRLWPTFEKAGKTAPFISTPYMRRAVEWAASDVKRGLRTLAKVRAPRTQEKRAVAEYRDARARVIREAFDRAAAMLHGDEARVIRLVDMENVSQAEAAERLGVSQQTVSRIRQRALRHIRERVSPELLVDQALRTSTRASDRLDAAGWPVGQDGGNIGRPRRSAYVDVAVDGVGLKYANDSATSE